MTAKLMVSNDPNLRKVRVIFFSYVSVKPVINRQALGSLRTAKGASLLCIMLL